MYRAFNLSSIKNLPEYYEPGRHVMENQRRQIRHSLDQFLSLQGIIDGRELENNWFPQIDCSVFISHAHADENLAISLMGYLKKHFGIDAFVDSTVWGYADELLMSIDKLHCFNSEKKTFIYENRNTSTAHVHAILCAALTKMLDRTESLFILSTVDSITAQSAVKESTTHSPWIYYELTVSELLQKPLERHFGRKELLEKAEAHTQMFSAREMMSLKVEYPVNIERLPKICEELLDRWVIANNENPLKNPLDVLYSMFPQNRGRIV